jgi:hypothetical protein
MWSPSSLSPLHPPYAGYGDITPKTDSERIFVLFVMVTQCFFLSYIIGGGMLVEVRASFGYLVHLYYYISGKFAHKHMG